MITADPKALAIEDIKKLAPKLSVYLYLTKRWMDWADSGAGEAKVVGAELGENGGTLIVSFSGGVFGCEKIPFDTRMRFLVKK